MTEQRHAQLLTCLGKELADLRTARVGSREDAVEELLATHGIHMHPRALASYEHASRIIPLPRLFDLCDLYEISPGALLESAHRRAGVEYRCPNCRRPT